LINEAIKAASVRHSRVGDDKMCKVMDLEGIMSASIGKDKQVSQHNEQKGLFEVD
jgi:hypothetical protein